MKQVAMARTSACAANNCGSH